MKIKRLSEKTKNLIAAGEVIERPASVIKELVENAIDAGAKNIQIDLEEAGKNLIIISDDGYGMCYEDLELAIERHTTSKLDESDIMNIRTFGFRGEALPSIASISKMTITTKIPSENLGYQLRTIGGAERKISKIAHNQGTKIEVRDLFFATPARLKFLKGDQSELNASLLLIKKIAIAHPHIGFYVNHNGKKAISLNPATLGSRIYQILGEEFRDNSMIVDLSNQETKITGYISVPTFNKASSDSQYLFINNRPVRDKLLGSALKVAYMDVLANNRYPVAVLFIETNPLDVDVNVHPAKTEVRFKDASGIRGLVINAIQQAIFTNSHRATTVNVQNYTISEQQDLNLVNRDIAIPQYIQPKYISTNCTHEANDSQKNMYRHTYFETPISVGSVNIENSVSNQNDSIQQGLSSSHNRSFFQEEPRLGYAYAQVHENYIISQTKDGIIIVDQHAAHERIVYEKLKNDYAVGKIIKNQLLLPEIVSIADCAKADLLESQIPNLESLGLVINRASQTHFSVLAVPNIATSCDIKGLISDIADELLDIEQGISLQKIIEHVLETIACHYSVRKGRILSISEMNELLRQMENTPLSGQCNHGRPTYVKISLKDIEKMFERT